MPCQASNNVYAYLCFFHVWSQQYFVFSIWLHFIVCGLWSWWFMTSSVAVNPAYTWLGHRYHGDVMSPVSNSASSQGGRLYIPLLCSFIWGKVSIGKSSHTTLFTVWSEVQIFTFTKLIFVPIYKILFFRAINNLISIHFRCDAIV